jgi:hypothetical protein
VVLVLTGYSNGTAQREKFCEERKEGTIYRAPTRARPGEKLVSAAIDAGVADVLALNDVDDVFGDVRGVIADALEVFGD